MSCFVLLFFAISTRFVSGDQFNLYGEAGQAYAIEVSIGHPPQKFNLIVDTGSTTLAVAGYPRQDGDKYFHSDNSTSVQDSGKQIQAKYSQSDWVGRLISDNIKIHSLPEIPEVKSDIGLITKSHKFFMNGSGWQGLLGLAYLPVGARGDHVVVESWLDFVDHALNKPMSFELNLCGPQSLTNSTHYGKFTVLGNSEVYNDNFRTPILHKRWYEVAVMSIRVLHTNESKPILNIDLVDSSMVDADMCLDLNQEKSIVDSGTTNIRLPDLIFRQVVDELKNSVRAANILIMDEFWYHAEAACWPEPQEWSLPWLAIDLLSAESDHQYFTLEIPAQNYMRVVSAHNSSDSGIVSEFCYKLGLEAGGKDTVLGYTAMEGLKVLFNRQAGWIGFQTSDCGPNARITGPYNTTRSIITVCDLLTPISDMAISIKAAQWALCVISLVAAAVLIYLLAPCIKMLLVKPLPRSTQISMSQTALVGDSASA